MNRLLKLFIVPATLEAMFTGCGSKPTWEVNGTVDKAEGKLLTLEASNNGRWYQVDTVTLAADGKFSFEQDAAGYPDVYRLTIGDKSVYFPIDSIETVTVTASGDNFSSGYTLAGSPRTDAFMRVENRLAQGLKTMGAAKLVNDEAFKRDMAQIILEDPSSVVAYYIINKHIGATPLYDPANRDDLRILGAVANAFTVNRPNDPRTAYLTSLFLNNRPNQGISTALLDSLKLAEVPMIDIALLDPSGKEVKLSELCLNGNVVLLNFTALTANESPAYNLELAKIYEKYHKNGFEIYQVSIDPDEFAWRQAARNLPWVSVYNGVNDPKVLNQYNVSTVPTMYILDRSGEVVERVESIAKLDSSLSKYI